MTSDSMEAARPQSAPDLLFRERKNTPESDKGRSLLGIKAKLFLAFCAMAGLTILAAAIAWYAFVTIERSVDRITAESVPAMGAFIEIEDNAIIDRPIMLHFIGDSTQGELVYQIRNLVVAGKFSKCTIIEKFDAIGENKSFTNVVTEIKVDESAFLKYFKIEDDSENAFHISNIHASQATNSNLTTNTYALNGAMVRNNLNIKLEAEGCESYMNGLYLLEGKTHVDNHTVVDHQKPNCYSNELYKGIMDGRSRGVFNGKIFVRQYAQKTNAFQSNKNILLSDKAIVNTKPQLEIWADDVKCSHGCTTGQLDKEALFYLQSRGIQKEKARGMLLQAFARATGDWDFMCEFGAEILYQTSRFWISRLELNEAEDRYELSRVIGPDEFHEHVDNNTFTNKMAQWHLVHAANTYSKLATEGAKEHAALVEKIGLSNPEVVHWREVAEMVYIPFDPDQNLIEQFSDYFKLDDVPITEWDENGMPRYPAGHDHFSLNSAMLLKQPDVVMLTYLLPDEFTEEVKKANFEFYEARTMHKSSLSPAIHAIMGIEVGDMSSAHRYFARSAYVDLTNNQGNTEDGIHIASAGGTWQSLVCGFGGFRVKQGRATFKPWLPEQWEELRFKIRWRGDRIKVSISHDAARFLLEAAPDRSETIEVNGRPLTLEGGREVAAPLDTG